MFHGHENKDNQFFMALSRLFNTNWFHSAGSKKKLGNIANFTIFEVKHNATFTNLNHKFPVTKFGVKKGHKLRHNYACKEH